MKLKIALPKGRLWESTKELLKKSGIGLDVEYRNYKCATESFQFYIVKPRNIPRLVESGMVDVGIVGKDLVVDESADVKYLLDLKTMPVYLVLAGKLDLRKKVGLTLATEYVGITRNLFPKSKLIKTYGSTECFVPEFSDMIVDHTQTGITLKKNRLKVFDILMKSTTQLICNKKLTPKKKKLIEKLTKKIEKGIEKMDFKYPDFITEDQIRNNGF